MNSPRKFLTAFFAASFLALAAHAADVTGNWKWTSQSKSGPTEITADLVQKDGAITGTITTRQGPAAIEDGSVKGATVTFTVTRSSGVATVVFTYTGTVAGDSITGTINRTGPTGAAPGKADWKATRTK